MDERLVTGRSGHLLVFISIGYMGVTITRQLLPPMLPTIIDDLAITSAAAGIALTILWGLYALSHYPGGHLADKLTRKTVFVAGCSFLVAGIGIMAVAVSYSLFLLSTVFIGCGAGLYFIAMRVLLADMYVERRGQAFGVQMALGFAGPIAASGIAVVTLRYATWRTVFPLLAIALGIVLLLAHRLLWEPYDVRPVSFPVRTTVGRLIGDDQIRSFLVVYILFATAYLGFTGFLPSLLQAERGFSPTLASAGFATVFAVALLMMPLAGFLGDRFGHVRMAFTGLSTAAFGLAILLSFPSVLGTWAGILTFSIGIWTFPPVMQAHVMDQFADTSMGGDFGAFKAVYSGIGSLSTSYIGLMSGWTSYSTAFWTLGSCLVLGAILLLFQGDSDGFKPL